MRYLVLGALACLLMTTPAYAQATDPAVVAPITTFIAAFNKGDVAGAAATHAAVADLVIVDEVAPYVWHGAKAFHAWVDDLGAVGRQARRHRPEGRDRRADARRGGGAPAPT